MFENTMTCLEMLHCIQREMGLVGRASMAKSQLVGLAQQEVEIACKSLGDGKETWLDLGAEPSSGRRYRISTEGHVESLFSTGWSRSGSFHDPNPNGDLSIKMFVAEQLLRALGCDPAWLTEDADKIKAKHQRLRDQLHAVLDAD